MNDYKLNSQNNFDRQSNRYDTASFGDHARKLHPILLRPLAQGRKVFLKYDLSEGCVVSSHSGSLSTRHTRPPKRL